MKALILFAILLFSSFSVAAQQKVAIDDNLEVLSLENIQTVSEKLKANGYTLDNSVDFSKRCEYQYIILEEVNDNKQIRIQNCEGKITGLKSIKIDLSTIEANERVTYLSYAIIETLNNPIAEQKEISDTVKKVDTQTEEEMFTTLVNEHNSRYFFSPSSYNLRKGELYYQTIYFLIHDIQYGLSDQFSLGIGTTVAGFPLYLTPKYSFEISEKHRMSLGDLFIVGTYGVNFIGNLFYATYTYGDEMTNFTLGGGFFYSNENDLFSEEVKKPVINFAAMAKLSPYLYFITENYYLPLNTEFTAYYYNYMTEPPQNIEETFKLRDHYLAGFVGFRLVSKQVDVRAWQVGLVYYNRFIEAIPGKYSGDLWNTSYPDLKRLVLPQVTFTYKFGKKY